MQYYIYNHSYKCKTAEMQHPHIPVTTLQLDTTCKLGCAHEIQSTTSKQKFLTSMTDYHKKNGYRKRNVHQFLHILVEMSQLIVKLSSLTGSPMHF